MVGCMQWWFYSRLGAIAASNTCLAMIFLGFILGSLATSKPLLAQSITPANDGTGTIVTQESNIFTITGGRLSSDGANLFQSLEKLGLSSGEIANFLVNPTVNNIFGRVIGGEPSIINGSLQITGGTPNLYLINPAGIVFGANASLNVPADFTATTATGIGFGDNHWFNVFGANEYQQLVGEPNQFLFGLSQPGSIINAGDLAVSSGQNLSLVAGSVINTGKLTASGGQITIAAIPGSNRVMISQPGQVLSLEVELPMQKSGEVLPFTPLDLASLLTGSGETINTGVEVTSSGTAQLTDSGTIIPNPAGMAVVSGTIDVATVVMQNLENASLIGGNVNLFGEKVALVDANLNVSGVNGGGQVLVGGEYQGQGNIFTSQHTFISQNSTINADALVNGNGGRVIVWGNEATRFNGTIQARGGQESGNGGFVEVSGKENLNFTGTVDVSAKRGTAGTLLIDPENITIINGSGGSDNDQVTGDNQVLFDDSPGQRFTIAESTLEGLLAEANVILEATNNITINNLFDNELTFAPGPGGSITFTADADGDQVGAFSMNSTDTIRADARNVTISGASLTIGIIDTATPLVIENINGINHTVNINGAPINLTATRGSIRINGLDGNLNSLVGRSITINTPSTLSVAGGLNARSDIAGNAGNVTIGNQLIPSSITVGEISARNLGSGGGGNINITTTGLLNVTRAFSRNTGLSVGQVSSNNNLSDLASIASEANGSGGTIRITANGGITTAAGIFSDSLMSGNGGTITINSRGNVQVSLIDAQGSQNGTGGNVNITTGGFFQTTGIITDQNQITASISTAGGVEGGSIFIEHGGGVRTPFSIGDASINGTIGSLTTGSNNSIVPFQSIVGSFSQGTPPADIQIVTKDQNSTGTSTGSGTATGISVPGFLSTSGGNLTVDPDSVSQGSLSNAIQSIYQRQNSSSAINGNEEQLNSIETLALVQEEETESFEVEDIQNELKQIEQATGIKPALIYVSFWPRQLSDRSREKELGLNQNDNYEETPEYLLSRGDPNTLSIEPRSDDQLELLLVTSSGQPIRMPLSNATYEEVRNAAIEFRGELEPRSKVERYKFKTNAQKFYQWLIAPLEKGLQQKNIDNLVFVMPQGLRSIPLAAIHDGKDYIITRYSVGLMPSMSLTDTRYVDVKNLQVLAMGASEFTATGLSPVPPSLSFVENEIDVITNELWSGESLVNESFTLEQLKLRRQEQPSGIVHLATHGNFNPERPNDSYILLWDGKLTFDQFRGLSLNKPPVELLVLSACETSLGNENSQLGFAGFAHQLGVKSVLGTLWEIDDNYTLKLMQYFYTQLKKAPIKAEALRQAQLAMLNDEELSHPHFWSGFTIVGNPW